MTTGVTSQGFVPKTVQELISDVEAAELVNIDPLLDTSPEQAVGQLNGIFCAKLAELWELGSVAYNSVNRDAAEGPQQDNIGALTGTKRLTAKPSYTLQTCIFSSAGDYPAGALVANVNGQAQTQFANGDDINLVTTGGSTTATDTRTGLVLATGTLPLTVPGIKFFCTANGPTVANANTLATITTPVSGWSSTNNPNDAVLGSLVEGDTAYKIRQELEIASVGSGNPDAMRADVLNVPGVLNAFVLENTTNFPDANGTPPHAFQVVIWDGPGASAANNDVAQAIWNDKPTGVLPFGTVTGLATDSEGNPEVVLFDRATQLQLYLTYTITLAPNAAPIATIAPQVKAAVVAATQGINVPELSPQILNLGSTVYSLAMKSAALTVAGVVNVSNLFLGFAPSPGGTADLPVGPLQIAIADTSRITVNGL